MWPSSTPLFHRSPPKVIAGKRTGGRGACEERERAVEVGGAAGAGGACRAELIPSHETARVGSPVPPLSAGAVGSRGAQGHRSAAYTFGHRMPRIMMCHCAAGCAALWSHVARAE
jgi:hypothetical protein